MSPPAKRALSRHHIQSNVVVSDSSGIMYPPIALSLQSQINPGSFSLPNTTQQKTAVHTQKTDLNHFERRKAMNIAQIALLAIKQSTKNTELSQAHSNITKKQQPKPLETFIIQRHPRDGKLDGARGGGSGGRSAGGRHPDQASGQPGAACAPLGEQAPPPAAAILHSFGRAGFSGGYSTQRHPSMDPDKGRPESPHQHPGIRIRPRSSPGLNAEVRNSKLPPLHRVA